MPGSKRERESVLHSWCIQSDWRAPTIVGGEGAWFIDDRGRRYLDMSSLAECSNLGHQHPDVVRAIRNQAEKLCFVTAAWGAEPRAELARLLLEKSGFNGGRVFFTLGGADANEHAVKFARQAAAKPRGLIMTRERSYHGASYATMALSGDARTISQSEEFAAGVVRVPPPYAYRCAFESSNAEDCGTRTVAHMMAEIERHGAQRIAAVLMEPNAGTNGIVAPANFWPALRSGTSARHVVLIADEVMSGFGRCGQWFAWQKYGEGGRPDIMTLAKGLTGAHLPLGAVVVSQAVAAALEHQMLYTGLTYCGHPLCCAAGVAAIRAYESGRLIERSRRLGSAMLHELKRMQTRHAVIGDVRGGEGLFAVIELVRDRHSRAELSPWPSMHPGLKRLIETAQESGISFAARGNLIILAPPLVIEEHELSDALAMLDRLLEQGEWI
jgi:taurine---2-oxoglutarate transaminase